MLVTNKKQALLFNSGEDLSYSSIQITLLVKSYDDFVNDPVKGDLQKTLLLFQIGRKSLVEYKWLLLHTTFKSLLDLFLMTDNQTV